MIIKEENQKVELEDCDCDKFLPFYRNANPSIFPAVKNEDNNLKLEPIEVC